MLSTVLSAAVDGYAALDRASDRRRMIEAAQARVGWHRGRGRERTLVIVRSPLEIRDRLAGVRDDSATVFVDCALECCVDEDELLGCWAELRRATGGSDERADDLFVLHIQRWASARVTFDPRVRFVLICAPPRRDRTGKLDYRAFGRRRTILADARGPRRSSQGKE